MEKFIVKNSYGEFTAVLISPDFGAGYSTWGHGNPMDGNVIRELLECVEDFNPDEVDEETEIDVSDYMANDNLYSICFIPVGTAFRINEYDGSESIEYYSPDDYYIA